MRNGGGGQIVQNRAGSVIVATNEGCWIDWVGKNMLLQYVLMLQESRHWIRSPLIRLALSKKEEKIQFFYIAVCTRHGICESYNKMPGEVSVEQVVDQADIRFVADWLLQMINL